MYKSNSLHSVYVYVANTAGWVTDSVETDQTPRSAASDLVLYCLPWLVCPSLEDKNCAESQCPELSAHPATCSSHLLLYNTFHSIQSSFWRRPQTLIGPCEYAGWACPTFFACAIKLLFCRRRITDVLFRICINCEMIDLYLFESYLICA